MGYDPQKILNTADSFLLAANRCFEQRPLGLGRFEMPMVPAIVCTAFAIELYLKAIITLESGTATGHDLWNLYNGLSEQAKDTLTKGLSIKHDDLNKKVKEASRVFVEWRYIFESESLKVDPAFLSGLAQACKTFVESKLKSASVRL